MKGGVDLNDECWFGQSCGFPPGGHHEHRQDPVRPAHGLLALDHIRPVRPVLWRRRWRSYAALCRAVPDHGVRPIDLSGESARHRGLPLGASRQALPHGLARTGATLHAGRCQRIPRLANLRQFRAAIDRSSKEALRPGRLGDGVVEHRLRLGLDNHRSVPVGISVGALPLDQGRCATRPSHSTASTPSGTIPSICAASASRIPSRARRSSSSPIR